MSQKRDMRDKSQIDILRENIDKAIAEKYKSIRNFALQKNIPKSTISKFLTDGNPRLTTLVEIAEALEMTVKIE